MSKRKTDMIENFGERLASLRKAAGYTQVEFAAEVGITQRMVAYYEAPNAQPPAHLLPQMAQVLGVGRLGQGCACDGEQQRRDAGPVRKSHGPVR